MQSRNFGFTLVETLVALWVLSVALTAIVGIISYNLGTANFVKNSFVASGLAQEGLEVVRNIRDNDWFAGNPFGTSLPVGIYQIQWDSTSLQSLGNPVLLRDAQGLHGYSGGTPTLFRRTVEVTYPNPEEAQVTVSVTWPERLGTKELKSELHLYNWY